MNRLKHFVDHSRVTSGAFVRLAPFAAILLVGLRYSTTASAAETQNEPASDKVAVQRAVSFLNEEIAAWNKGHACFSCHNNGDAIRALLVASHYGHQVESEELQKTVAWLRRPREWSQNGPEGEFNDRRLARLQFASALAAAERDEESAQRPLHVAAGMLAEDFRPDGSWPDEQIGTIGSPITYGHYLATALASRVLAQTDDARFAEHVRRANRWLRASRPESVLNAAAVLWSIAKDPHRDAASQRKKCLQLISRGQSDDGGWGPYVTSASEPFDTAVVLLALQATGRKDHAEMIKNGREFLVKSQWSDGSWPETTRPADRDSYAHRVSTAAWCLHALVLDAGKTAADQK